MGLNRFEYLHAGSLNEFCKAPWSARIVAEKIHGLGDHSAGAAEGTPVGINRCGNALMVVIVSVQVSNERTGVDQERFQRQFCFLSFFAQESFGFPS